MNPLQEKLAAAEAKVKKYEAALEVGASLTPEQLTEFKGAVSEIESINEQLNLLERSTKARADLDRPASAGVPLPTGAPVPDATAQRKSLILRSSIGADLSRWQGETRAEKAENAYDFGMWALSLIGEGRLGNLAVKARNYCEQKGIIAKAHYERDNETGGFFVPTQFVQTIIDLRNQYGQFRQFADVVPMSSDTLEMPRRVSGLTAYWGSEGGTYTESTLGFDKVSLVAKKLTALAIISTELSEDAVIDMANRIAEEIAYSFAIAEDQAGFLGDGTSTYGGIVGVLPKLKGLSATIANIAGLVVGAGNAYSELTLANFRSVVAKLPTYAMNRGASWFVNRVLYYEHMVKLAEDAGGTTATEIINGQRRDMFMGYPVNLIEVFPSTEANSQVCALFGNLRLAAMMGDRRSLSVMRSEHVRFTSDELVIKGSCRLDINVHDVGNASGTASQRVAGPVVGLITAAS